MIWLVFGLVLVCCFLFLAALGLHTQLEASRKRADNLERMLRESMKLTDDGLSFILETAAHLSRVARTSEMRH
jgi:hypothetical protein